MTCPPCTHDCDQSRTCPARVAHVGQRMHAPEALPPLTWRAALTDASVAVLAVYAVYCISVFVVIAVTL